MFIHCPDGSRLACTLTLPNLVNYPHRYVVINSATAVRRGFYTAFANHLAQAGFHVLTWDARSIGDSKTGHARHEKARMRDWGTLDLEAVLQHVNGLAEGDWSRIAVIGHSSGGHLSGLALSIRHVRQLALVASGTCDWRLYPKREWPRLLGAWYGLAPLALTALGYMPGSWGVGHDLAPGVGWDWRNWSARRGYLFSDPSLDLSGYAAFKGDLLALHFSDDTGFAPAATVLDLVRQFPQARLQREEFNPRQVGHTPVGHFGFFNKKNADLWPIVSGWLK
jgi:predicted alpha/beta hydrolase